MALDIGGHVAPEIAFDLEALIHDLADLDYVVVVQVIGLEIERDARLVENIARSAPPDAVNIRERDFHSLAARQIHPCDPCHFSLPGEMWTRRPPESHFPCLNRNPRRQPWR